MSEIPCSADEWPLSLAQRVNEVCDRFEQACQAGRRPRVEDYLAGESGSGRDALAQELILLEIHYRRRDGDDSRVEDYQNRFPGLDSQWLADALGSATGPHERATGGSARSAMGLPSSVGGYEILEELGRGGMGVVYRALQVRLSREVALKTVRAPLPGGRHRQRLEAEARALAKLDHPNLVRVLDSGEVDGQPWFALELVKGGTLSCGAEEGSLAAARRRPDGAASLAEAVQYAHDKGVIHRDLKPANVLLDEAGVPKIADFGLTRLLEGDSQPMTEAGCCLGTPPYMPPEQAAGLSRTSGRSVDVFGLGAILYELLTGQAPFAAGSGAEALERARSGEVKRPRSLERRIPPVLERICLKALARRPEDRYATAGELARDLRRYLARPRPWLMAGLVFAAALLVALGWLLRGGPTPRPLSADELIVTITSRDQVSKRSLRIDQPGALPARATDGFHVEARLNQPAHVYMVLLSSEGGVVPLYPWNADTLAQEKLAAPPVLPPRATVHSPAAADKDWELDENDGLETVLVMARKTTLPDGVDLAGLIGTPPRARLLHPLEWAVRGGNQEQPVDYFDLGEHRGIKKVARERDDPLLKIMGRLRQEFEVVQAVRFAHQGR